MHVFFLQIVKLLSFIFKGAIRGYIFISGISEMGLTISIKFGMLNLLATQ